MGYGQGKVGWGCKGGMGGSFSEVSAARSRGSRERACLLKTPMSFDRERGEDALYARVKQETLFLMLSAKKPSRFRPKPRFSKKWAAQPAERKSSFPEIPTY